MPRKFTLKHYIKAPTPTDPLDVDLSMDTRARYELETPMQALYKLC